MSLHEWLANAFGNVYKTIKNVGLVMLTVFLKRKKVYISGDEDNTRHNTSPVVDKRTRTQRTLSCSPIMRKCGSYFWLITEIYKYKMLKFKMGEYQDWKGSEQYWGLDLESRIFSIHFSVLYLLLNILWLNITGFNFNFTDQYPYPG